MHSTTESGLQADMAVDMEITNCEEEEASPPQNVKERKQNLKSRFKYSKGKQKVKKLCTVLKLLQYADKKNKAMLIISFISAIASGAITPLNITTVLAPAVSLFVVEERKFYLNESQNESMTVDEILPMKLEQYGYNFYIFSAASIVAGFIQITLSERSSQNILAKIKTDYLAKLLSVNIAWYDKCEEQFVNTVSHDLQKMKGLFDSQMTSAVEIISFFIFGNIAGFQASIKVSVITFTIQMIALAIIYMLMQLSKSQGKKQRLYNGICAKLTSEVLGNARTVAAYGGEMYEIDRFDKPLNTTLKYGFKQSTILSLAKAFNYFIFCVCYAGTYYFAAWLYIRDLFTPGHLVIVLIAQINVIYHSTALLSTISDLFMAMDSAYRVMSVIETETNYKSTFKTGATSANFTGDIRFRNVVFSYPTNIQTKVLTNLSLNIQPGKITAVVGTSGAGKSTIVGLITRLYDINSGQILIDGVDLKEINISWLRNQIGVVMQEPTLFDATIEENIRVGKPDATREEIEAAAKLSYAHSFIKNLPAGYNSVVGERGVKLSGGQKQRIAIARALVRKPKLLLLDEATSALDTQSEEIVQEALDNAMKGRTTVIIAHRMSTVQKADIVYAMKSGAVVECGSHEELMEFRGYYYNLVKIQELEEKDKASKTSCRRLSGDERTEEKEIASEQEEDSTRDNCKKLHLRLKNIKVYLMWFLALIFCCFTSAFLPAFYFVFTLICQTFSHPKEDIEIITERNVINLVGIGIIVFLAVMGSGLSSTKATQMWLGKARRKAFRKIVSMDISWFDRKGNTPNETLEILTNCPTLVELVAGDRAAQVLIFFLSIIFTLIYSIFVNSRITLVNLPIILIFILINAWRLRSKMSDTKASSHTTKSTKIATEYVQNVKTIQLLNCQNYVIAQYQKLLKLAKKEAFKGVVFYAFVYGLSKALIRIAMGSTFIFGGPLIAAGIVRGSQLLGIVIALSTASMLAGPSLVLMSQYPAARQALSRLYGIIYASTELSVISEEGQKPEINGNIIFKDINFSYPTRQKVQVLNKLNLHFEAGKTTALVGNSGCGKSTIISLLERFYMPTGGEIIIDGVDINSINVRYLRSQMGLVSQEPVLFDLSVKENILYGITEPVSDDCIMKAAKIANIHEFIMKLPQAYDTMVGERGSKLSGGQKQRIAIARAVLRDPKILLLDEATSALDTESEKIVQEALEKASIGRTTIVIAHRLSTIRKADRIAVLQAGTVVEQGTHDQLINKRGHYFRLLHQT